MSSHKSPFTDWVAAIWDGLVLENRDRIPLDERRRRWRELYDRTYVDGQWVVGPWDAALVSSLGESIALEELDYKLAIDLDGQYLAHPAARDNRIGYHNALARKGVLEIADGSEQVGIERLRQALATEDHSFLSQLRYELLTLCRVANQTDVPSRELGAFIGTAVGRFRGCKGRSVAASRATNYAELGAIVQETVGRSIASN